jgi:hypothetical protein
MDLNQSFPFARMRRLLFRSLKLLDPKGGEAEENYVPGMGG